jgi:methylated-DNA-[protein]-cysteine S-methyltransferase
MNFQEKVFAITRKIPGGKVSTYKEVACALKKPKAYRAVGNALNKNVNRSVPCHRVIKSDGSVGGFRWGSRKKIKKLKEEGVEIKNSKIDLNKHLYEF